MANIETELQKTISSVPDCIAAGYIDLDSGMVLGMKTVDSHPIEVLNLVAAATADLFQGPNVAAIEKMFRIARGLPEDGRHYFQEIIVNSDNLIHIFLRNKSQKHVLVIVCRKGANLGMVLMKIRLALPSVESSF